MADRSVGRPEFVLSDDDFDKLERLVRIQCTQVEICAVFGITEKTISLALKKRGEGNFSQFYKKNMNHGRTSLRRSQWSLADKGNPTMLIWLGKQHLDQRDKSDVASTHALTDPLTEMLAQVAQSKTRIGT